MPLLLTLARLYKLLELRPRSPHRNHDARFNLADARVLERAFPGCTAALDLNPRIRDEWAGETFRLIDAEHGRGRSPIGWHRPEAGWEGYLVASRTTAYGTVHITRARKIRMSHEYVEQAVYVPSEERWVVIR